MPFGTLGLAPRLFNKQIENFFGKSLPSFLFVFCFCVFNIAYLWPESIVYHPQLKFDMIDKVKYENYILIFSDCMLILRVIW